MPPPPPSPLPAPLPPKAQSVTAQGAPDGFDPPLAWFAQVIPGGYTRLVVSAPGHRMAELHQALVARLRPPLRVLYRQLTDRATGQLPKARDWVGVELSTERVLAALQANNPLVYHDGRHQLWLRGQGEEQVVLEEIGVLYVYPDDPSFRDTLLAEGVPEAMVQTLAERDYIKVNFLSEADAQEQRFQQALAMARWA